MVPHFAVLLAGLLSSAIVPPDDVAAPGEYEIGTQAEIDDRTQATDIDYAEDSHTRMTIPVRLSGAGPFRFLIDTGADRSAISIRLARRLGLTAGPSADLHSVTGMRRVGTANVPSMDYEARRVNNVEAALLEAENIGADGILGLDSLQSQRIVFNFRDEILTIVPTRSKVVDEDGTIVVTTQRRDGRLVIARARVENTRVAVVIDTGAQVTIGNRALRERLERSGRLRTAGQVELHSVTGETIVGDYMFIKRFDLGGVILSDLAIVFAESDLFRELDLDDRPAALLGMNALRVFDKVSIDFERRKLRVVVPAETMLRRTLHAGL